MCVDTLWDIPTYVLFAADSASEVEPEVTVTAPKELALEAPHLDTTHRESDSDSELVSLLLQCKWQIITPF